MAQHEADHFRAFCRMPGVLSEKYAASVPVGIMPAVYDRQSADNLDCRTIELMQILTRHFPVNLGAGTVILDLSHRVLSCSEGAAYLLRSGDSPLQLHYRGLIVIGSPETRTRLHRLLTTANGVIGIFSAGSRWLSVSAQRQGSENIIRVALREIALPDRQQTETRLAQMFDLTRAEARLAAALAAGLSLHESAQACGTRVGTARNYLIRVFRKTATHRQSQLVALICRAMVESAP